MDEKKKVLIVDDEQAFNRVMRERLTMDGYDAISAYDGAQGIQFARQQQPDLIILDINLPAGRGDAIYKRLKEFEYTSHIPIIIITALPVEEIEKKLYELGVEKDNMFYKPVDFDTLAERIGALLT
ncbi:MAG: response regulator [Elusimicrobiota bacterium]